jgi:hypothetical protein
VPFRNGNLNFIVDVLTISFDVRFKILSPVKKQIKTVWAAMPCHLIGGNQVDMFLQNSCDHEQDTWGQNPEDQNRYWHTLIWILRELF